LWHPEDFLNRDCLVAEFNQAIVGYVVSHEICPPLAGMVAEREILNLAVDAPYRRLGIAGRLLRAELRRGGIHLLEVRESNHAAQALYQKFGFEQIGQRPGYYQSPVEAAIVMRSFPVL
jgi:ribosomal protein S18 acetylase RimI-like enzyme